MESSFKNYKDYRKSNQRVISLDINSKFSEGWILTPLIVKHILACKISLVASVPHNSVEENYTQKQQIYCSLSPFRMTRRMKPMRLNSTSHNLTSDSRSIVKLVGGVDHVTLDKRRVYSIIWSEVKKIKFQRLLQLRSFPHWNFRTKCME